MMEEEDYTARDKAPRSVKGRIKIEVGVRLSGECKVSAVRMSVGVG